MSVERHGRHERSPEVASPHSSRRGARRTGRGLVLAALIVSAAACGDSAPMDPVPETPPTVMVLSDGGTETHITSILTDAGMAVVDGGPFSEFVGAGLEDVDAVVLPAAIDWSDDLEPTGEAALVGYVLQGGGLFTIEWVTYNSWPLLPVILPAVYSGGYDYETEEYSVAVNDEVTEGLPSTFMPGPDHARVYLDPKPGTTTWITGSVTGAVLVGWEASGRVISWNGAAEYNGSDVWNDDLDLMVVNAIRYAAGGPRDILPALTSMITLNAVELDITNDGDTSAGDGDFYFTVGLSVDINGIETQLAGYDDALRQGSDGEVIPVNVDASTTLPAIDGMVVTALVSYYENDAGGPQATTEASVEFTYDVAGGCWAAGASSACVSPGESLASDLVLQDTVGEPLDVSLEWTFAVQ